MIKKAAALLLILLLMRITAVAQTVASSSCLLKLLVNDGSFVILKPINSIRWQDHWLIPDDTVNHSDNRYGYKRFKELGISVKTVKELVANGQKVDTTNWTSKELGNVLLIKQRDSYLQIQETLATLGLTDETQIKKYRKRIRQFNNTSSENRYIYRVSRPVFDTSGNYAAVIESSGAAGLSGGGSLLIFERKPDGWHQLGAPKRWAY